jgi:hypothetical protein
LPSQRIRALVLGRVALDRPEDRQRALGPVRADQREGGRFDLVHPPVEAADAEAAVGGAGGAQRPDHRQVVVGDDLAVGVARPEHPVPFVAPDMADLVEALAEQGPGGLVVEDQQPTLVDQEGRRRESRHQVPGKDQLKRLLRHR